MFIIWTRLERVPPPPIVSALKSHPRLTDAPFLLAEERVSVNDRAADWLPVPEPMSHYMTSKVLRCL